MRKLGILKEDSGKSIVALSPKNVRVLSEYYDVYVEHDAGVYLGYNNEDYIKSGARITKDRIGLIGISEVVVSFNSTSNIAFGSKLKAIVGYYDVLSNFSTIAPFINLNLDLYSLDLIPDTDFYNPACVLSELPVISEVKNDLDLESINEMFTLFLIQLKIKDSQNECLNIIENTKILSKGKLVNKRIIEEVNRF